MKTFHRILVPVDFSGCSNAAIEQAFTLSLQTGASLHLLHVLEALMYAPAEMTAITNRDPDFHAEATRHLNAIVRSLEGRGNSKVDGEIVIGIVADTIVDQANRGKYDLVVLGTHGRTGVRHALIGSVAEQVVRRAQIPVLTVRCEVRPL